MRCPRCGGRLFAEGDDLACLACGYLQVGFVQHEYPIVDRIVAKPERPKPVLTIVPPQVRKAKRNEWQRKYMKGYRKGVKVGRGGRANNGRCKTCGSGYGSFAHRKHTIYASVVTDI